MDGIKREELKKACKKIHKVRARMAAVRMVQVLDMSVEETASITIQDFLRHVTGVVRDFRTAMTRPELFTSKGISMRRSLLVH